MIIENEQSTQKLFTLGMSMSTVLNPAKVIAITSGKGGVGKTNTSVNLGLALHKQGRKVLLLDADLGLANVNIILGFEPGETIQAVIEGKATIDDVIVKHDLGIDIIPASSGIQKMTNLSEVERAALMQAMDSLSKKYDYILIDTAAGIGDNVLYFTVGSEEIFLVIDQEPTSITDAYAVIKVLSTDYGVKDFSVIANRTPRGKNGKDAYAKLSAVTGKFLNVHLKYLGSISEDELLNASVLQRKPCIELFPSTKASIDYITLAKKVLENEGKRNHRGGLQFFFDELVKVEN